jgi:hypothetical protein
MTVMGWFDKKSRYAAPEGSHFGRNKNNLIHFLKLNAAAAISALIWWPSNPLR